MHFVMLDQSLLSCGWSRFETEWDRPRCGVWPLAESLKYMASGFITLQRNLNEIHTETPIDVLGYEEPILRPTDKVEKLIALYGLVAHILSFAKAKKIRVVSSRSDRWRKHFIPPVVINSTDDWKFLAVKRCRELGFDPEDHNAAEACGILDYQLHVLGVQPPWAKTGALL